MEYEGMVHALEEIHRLLKPDSCVIDIHPVLEAPLVKVYHGANVLFVESDPDYDYEEDLRQAEDALAQVIQRRLFVIEHSSEFDLLLMHHPSQNYGIIGNRQAHTMTLLKQMQWKRG